ncbi:hypothetical protein MtrunA17_Chr8g0391791 [Medicago truncatula]|uniref:Uncharacterized protein n=1 Tax=Medicago truncatula TaxID=3880 RepID=A0A396GRP6_MEDTR|nr:hypothetical protein MtrunA17_Chr8g0391791 [Medicago truncatula]
MSFFLGGVGTVEHIDETRDSRTGVVMRGSDEILISVPPHPSPLYKVDKIMRRNLWGFN